MADIKRPRVLKERILDDSLRRQVMEPQIRPIKALHRRSHLLVQAAAAGADSSKFLRSSKRSPLSLLSLDF
jgi:hypothetical protein